MSEITQHEIFETVAFLTQKNELAQAYRLNSSTKITFWKSSVYFQVSAGEYYIVYFNLVINNITMADSNAELTWRYEMKVGWFNNKYH